MAVRIKGLSKTYKGKKGRLIDALKGMTLDVEEGEVFGFLGPNGAGKSTTIKVLTGQISASAGEATIFGTPVSDPRARLRVGYLPENPSFYDFMTAREYLRFVGRAFAMDPERIAIESERVLGLMELGDAAKRPIKGFSKGMVQRLGMAQSLLHDPDLYILDEPMSGLDPMGRALVKDIIKDLKAKGKTVFFSTHITADVEVVCDRLGIIVAGNLRAVDRVQALLQGGVTGYKVQVILTDQATAEMVVAAGELQQKLESVWEKGGRVERIDPIRRNLEDFFLEVVATAENEN